MTISVFISKCLLKWLITESEKLGQCFLEFAICEHLSCEMLLKINFVGKHIWVMLCFMPPLRESQSQYTLVY